MADGDGAGPCERRVRVPALAATTQCRRRPEEDTTDTYDDDSCPYSLDPELDAPGQLPPPRLPVQVPGFIREDLDAMAFRAPEHYRAHCITAQHSLGKADEEEPILVSRTHTEVVDGEELTFCLLVFRPSDGFGFHPGVLFGEIGIPTALYEELVRDIGVRRPLPQEARVPDQYDIPPADVDDELWAELLNGSAPPREDDIPF